MQERGQVSTEELAMKLNEEVRWEEEQSPAHGEGMYHSYLKCFLSQIMSLYQA